MSQRAQTALTRLATFSAGTLIARHLCISAYVPWSPPASNMHRDMSLHTHRFTDAALPCGTCGESFVFTAGEQELQAVRGLGMSPRQCPRCRRSRPLTAAAERSGSSAQGGSS